MLQVKVGSYFISTDSGDNTVSLSGEYYEPGFNIMTPLELSFPKSDQITLWIRKRANDDGTELSFMHIENMVISVTDPTNGQPVPFTIQYYSSYSLILKITNALTLSGSGVRVRTMDVHFEDSSDNDFITFRVIVDDDDKNFHYIFIDSNNMDERILATYQGRDIYLSTKASSDHYLLFSPYAYFKENTESNSDFSYPLNTIFYKRQDAYNDEDYSYSISLYSHSFMRNIVSVMSIPSYEKAGVLLIDNRIYKDIIENRINPYIDIAVHGRLSGIDDTFRINFTV